MKGLTYDTGALIAAERGSPQMWGLHRRTLSRGVVPTVPAVVLAQGWRGGPQPQMSRLLAGCYVEPLDEHSARSAGAVCGLAGTSDIVDATVVVGAVLRGDLVVTSDPNDIRNLAQANGFAVDVQEP